MGEPATVTYQTPRQPVTFDRDSLTLRIGTKSVAVPDLSAGNEAMLRAYLDLVAEVRGTPIGSGIELRHDDVVVLAEILDLSDADLEKHLVTLLGVSANVAADVHRRLRKHRAFTAAATLSVGGFLLLGAKQLPSDPPRSQPIVHTVDVVEQPTTSTEPPAPVEPAAHAQPTMPEDQIGDALVIERGEQPADPNTRIGDAVTYER